MKDTLRDDCDDEADCVRNCCVSSIIAPIFFVIFVLMAQFVLVNVVVAVLMKHLEESHKQIEDDEMDMEELERELEQVHKFEEEQALCMHLEGQTVVRQRSMAKVLSLPPDFTYTSPIFESRYNSQRRQTFQSLGYGNRFADFNYTTAINGNRSADNVRAAEIELGEMPSKSRRRANSSQIELGSRAMATSRRPNNERKFEQESLLDETCSSLKLPNEAAMAKRFSTDSAHSRESKSSNLTTKIDQKPTDKCSNRSLSDKLTSSKDSLVLAADNARKSLYRRSSLKCDYGNTQATRTPIALLRSQSVNRSGSCRQLFKQNTMDDEADIDENNENSLLLPVLYKLQSRGTSGKNGKNDEETSLYYKNRENE